MPRRALVVGINSYDHMPQLESCVRDAIEMKKRLERHEMDNYRNYHCHTLTGTDRKISRAVLRGACEDLFRFDDKVLFYFSGHGTPTGHDGWLVTQDGQANDPGLPMSELLDMANRSKAASVLLILDCCHSGEIGNPPNLPDRHAQVREGVSILAASRRFQPALENSRHGVFTQLVLEALDGGAADIRGRVNAASIYAYVSAALGPLDQRPIFKSHITSLPSVRRCNPVLEDVELQQLPKLFPTRDTKVLFDGHEEFGRLLERLRDSRLAQVENGGVDDETSSPAATLTPLGRSYWSLAKRRQV